MHMACSVDYNPDSLFSSLGKSSIQTKTTYLHLLQLHQYDHEPIASPPSLLVQ